jgi:hypothetical protein
VRTIVETRTFSRKAATVWTEAQHEEFLTYIAAHSGAGQVVPGSGGVRKIRWMGRRPGKRGGVRVIYFNQGNGVTWLLAIYAKSEREAIPPHELRMIAEAIDGKAE